MTAKKGAAEVIVSPQSDGFVAVAEPTDMSAAMSLFGSANPAAAFHRMQEVATVITEPIRALKMYANISGKDHLTVEAWQLIGGLVGVTSRNVWSRPTTTDEGVRGWEAREEAVTVDQRVVGSAESMCLRSEPSWKQRDEYALRSMAQTRAQSKALSRPLRFIAVLAGFSGTPAEEMSHADGEPEPTYGKCPACGVGDVIKAVKKKDGQPYAKCSAGNYRDKSTCQWVNWEPDFDALAARETAATTQAQRGTSTAGVAPSSTPAARAASSSRPASNGDRGRPVREPIEVDGSPKACPECVTGNLELVLWPDGGRQISCSDWAHCRYRERVPDESTAAEHVAAVAGAVSAAAGGDVDPDSIPF